MRIADSCMKKEKEKGKSIPEDRQDPKECFSDVINQSRIRKTDFSLAPHTGGQKNLWKRMTCSQVQLIPFFASQCYLTCCDNFFQAAFACSSGNDLHICRVT